MALIALIFLFLYQNFEVDGEECVKAHLLSEGTHRFREPSCEVVIIVEEETNCIPILSCDYTESCNLENSLDISDGLGGSDSFCESFRIHSSSNSDHLFIRSGENPPECFVTCGENEMDSKPLEISQRRKFSDSCECGKKAPVKSQFGTRIFDGEITKPLEYPWMAQIMAVSKDHSYKPDPTCGAAIINDRTLLTASHCSMNDRQIWIKINKSSEIGVDEFSERLILKRILRHPLWVGQIDHNSWRFDITILQLSEPINFLKDRGLSGPVCLDQDRFRNREGDSGGPMTIELSQDKWSQLGIASFGGCNTGNVVYTKVSEFLPWIFHNSNDAIWCRE